MGDRGLRGCRCKRVVNHAFIFPHGEGWEIMGIMNDKYILISRASGIVIYGPMDWFCEEDS